MALPSPKKYFEDRNKKTRMDSFKAVGLAEGFIEGTEEEQVEAWQYIWDKGLWRGLQGWFGRTVHSLIEQGVIHK